jgi:hypothetical protein
MTFVVGIVVGVILFQNMACVLPIGTPVSLPQARVLPIGRNVAHVLIGMLSAYHRLMTCVVYIVVLFYIVLGLPFGVPFVCMLLCCQVMFILKKKKLF